MTAPRPWTDADNAVLRREAPFRSWDELATMLGRTCRAVAKHANDIGIRRGPKHAEWSAVEVAQLRAEYPARDTQDVAAIVGRTYAATRAKAFELGIEKNPAFMAAQRTKNARAAALSRSSAAFHQCRAGRFEREGGTWSPTQDAVKYLQRIGPIWRCGADGQFDAQGAFWKFGGRVMDAAAVEARAERSGWVCP